MDAFWNAHGHAIEPAGGEGPSGVYHRVVTDPVDARVLRGARGVQPRDEPRGECEGTQVLLAEYVSATPLTPGDPGDAPFSRGVHFLSCLGGREMADGPVG